MSHLSFCPSCTAFFRNVQPVRPNSHFGKKQVLDYTNDPELLPRKKLAPPQARETLFTPQDKATLRCDVPSGATIRSNPLILVGVAVKRGKVLRQAHSLLRQTTISPIPWQSRLKQRLQLCLTTVMLKAAGGVCYELLNKNTSRMALCFWCIF